VLGVGALSGGVEGAALQIRQAVHRVAVLQDVEHPQGVEGQQLYAAVGAVVEGGGQVGGNGGDVQLPVGQPGHDVVGGVGAQGHLIAQQGAALIGAGLHLGIRRVVVGEHLGRPHAGGAAEQAQMDGLI